jgi:putative spermidine/putrescine transport system permease protein
MGPSGAQYAATLVYQQFVSTFDWPRGATIAALLLLITLAALLTILAGANRRYARLLRES